MFFPGKYGRKAVVPRRNTAGRRPESENENASKGSRMRDVLERMGRIIRSQVFAPREALARRMEETLRRLEARAARQSAGRTDDGPKDFQGKQKTDGWRYSRHDDGSDAPPDAGPLAEDLAVFGLTPPSSLNEVKRVRNREIKKYHPDRFQNDPARRETAKEIMQIYNAAYDRLRRHYEV